MAQRPLWIWKTIFRPEACSAKCERKARHLGNQHARGTHWARSQDIEGLKIGVVFTYIEGSTKQSRERAESRLSSRLAQRSITCFWPLLENLPVHLEERGQRSGFWERNQWLQNKVGSLRHKWHARESRPQTDARSRCVWVGTEAIQNF